MTFHTRSLRHGPLSPGSMQQAFRGGPCH
jgi:hypothetical protein